MSTILAVVETSGPVNADTELALTQRGFRRIAGPGGVPDYLARLDTTLEDLIRWLSGLDWSGQPDMPFLAFSIDGAPEFSYYKLAARVTR